MLLKNADGDPTDAGEFHCARRGLPGHGSRAYESQGLMAELEDPHSRSPHVQPHLRCFPEPPPPTEICKASSRFLFDVDQTLTSWRWRRFGRPRREEMTAEQKARYGGAFRDAASGREFIDLPGLQAAFQTLGLSDVPIEDIECRPQTPNP